MAYRPLPIPILPWNNTVGVGWLGSTIHQQMDQGSETILQAPNRMLVQAGPHVRVQPAALPAFTA